MKEFANLILLLIVLIGVFALGVVHPDTVEKTSGIVLYILGHFIGGQLSENKERL